MDRIIVIGDSHSQLFDNNKSLGRGTWENENLDVFDVRWLGPVTYWRLCRDQNNFINLNDFCQPGQNVMISLGEIDIRSNILKYNQDSPIENIDYMIDKINNFIINSKNNINLHLISIIPPIKSSNCISINSDFPFIGTDDERRKLTEYFNKCLKKIAKKNSIGYFDIHKVYSDNKGFLDIESSDKIVHGIKTKKLETEIKKYFNL